MNYAEMSDFEINCEVLVAIEPAVEHMQLSADQKSFFHCGYDGNGFYETAIPDYCNSWADAGPIIEKFKISLIAMHHQVSCWQADAGEDCEFEISKQDNPLRAAMIVFLMMQEKANA